MYIPTSDEVRFKYSSSNLAILLNYDVNLYYFFKKLESDHNQFADIYYWSLTHI